MRILNLYAGIGGNRKLWPDGHEITAVEMNPEIAKIYQDFFPDDKVIEGDAHEYLLGHYKEFDFIWSSPPCPSHSKIRKIFANAPGQQKREVIYPDMSLYQEIILLQKSGPRDLKYCIENVEPYYKPLIEPQRKGRHCFWTNFYISGDFKSQAVIEKETLGSLQKLYGFDLKKYKLDYDLKKYKLDYDLKRKILRNCVDPKLGLHVWNCAFKNVQLELF